MEVQRPAWVDFEDDNHTIHMHWLVLIVERNVLPKQHNKALERPKI